MSINVKAAAGSAGVIVAYAFSQGGSAAIGSNLTYPILFSAGASAVYDMAPVIGASLSPVIADSRMARAAFIMGAEVIGLMVLYPSLSMQERMIFGALGAAGAYGFSM